MRLAKVYLHFLNFINTILGYFKSKENTYNDDKAIQNQAKEEGIY